MELNREEASFTWSGGEPLLAGIDFFKKVVKYQKKYGQSGQVVANSIPTNGTLLNPKFIEFLSNTIF